MQEGINDLKIAISYLKEKSTIYAKYYRGGRVIKHKPA